jgi:hypothetical protein
MTTKQHCDAPDCPNTIAPDNASQFWLRLILPQSAQSAAWPYPPELEFCSLACLARFVDHEQQRQSARG